MADKSPVLARPHIPKASTRLDAPDEAIADIRAQLDTTRLAGVMLCCATSYDFDALGPAIASAFDCPVLAVASEGELHFGHDQHSIIGVGFPSALFDVQAMHAWPVASTMQAATALKAHDGGMLDQQDHLGLVCFDGRSELREPLLSMGAVFDQLTLAGAASGLVNGHGSVYAAGSFQENYAACMVLMSHVRFEPFSIEIELSDLNAVDYQLLVDALKKRMPDILFTLGFEDLQYRHQPCASTMDISSALNTLNMSGFSTTAQLVGREVRSRGVSGIVFGA
ncbi:MAG: FIST N-terminal domain-containing protein [Bacteroidota bacterium]